jgi:hypothetical protein
MIVKRFFSAVVAIAGLAGLTFGMPANAVPISVEIFANQNSSTGGINLDTGLDLMAGDRLISTVDPQDCWSAGPGNRISNANGLDGLSPAPCQPTGDFGFHMQDGQSFRFGALVGRIGGSDWFLLGTDFDAVVSATGRLFLVYWDSNAGDNFGSVTAFIDVNPSQVPTPVPTPGTLLLLGTGLMLLAAGRKARRQ